MAALALSLGQCVHACVAFVVTSLSRCSYPVLCSAMLPPLQLIGDQADYLRVEQTFIHSQNVVSARYELYSCVCVRPLKHAMLDCHY